MKPRRADGQPIETTRTARRNRASPGWILSNLGYQRQRFRMMMQAADGRTAGASYREIGIALFGERRVLSEPWKTSPLRAVVIALARNASALIGGGYLGLLRHRRKP